MIYGIFNTSKTHILTTHHQYKILLSKMIQINYPTNSSFATKKKQKNIFSLNLTIRKYFKLNKIHVHTHMHTYIHTLRITSQH